MDKILKICRVEAGIQEAIENKLRLDKWYVKSTHGNIYQTGLPDLYVAHVKYGARWIEVKNELRYSFTPAQMIEFPLLAAAGVGVWVATSVHQVPDILFKPYNWYHYLAILNSRGHGA